MECNMLQEFLGFEDLTPHFHCEENYLRCEGLRVAQEGKIKLYLGSTILAKQMHIAHQQEPTVCFD